MRKSARFLKGGFTLVELLVVIAIIGVLAAVLLIGINPVEQMNKARDAGKLSKAKEAIGAAERYYAARSGSSTYTEPADCGALITALELKTGGCTDITLYGSNGGALATANGSYSAIFTPVSRTYRDKCIAASGGADTTSTCLVPNEI